MKYLLLTLFLGISSIFYAQFTEPTKNHVITEIDGDVVIDWYSENDTIPIPTAELEEFFLALDTLETQDSLKSNLILDLERTIKLYELLAEQDSLVIKFKDEEIYLYCRSGNRSGKANIILIDAGYQNTINAGSIKEASELLGINIIN